jgi:hypothetical protein
MLLVVNNTLSSLSLNTSTILCKIGNCISLEGGGILAALLAALLATTSAFDKRVARDILIAALGRELAV